MELSSFKPMLACTCPVDKIVLPVYVSPKVDGVRGVNVGGVLKTRALKSVPNTYTQDLFSRAELAGLDGELVVGELTSKDVYLRSSAELRSFSGEPDVTFYVFDYVSDGVYVERLKSLQSKIAELPQHLINRVVALPSTLVTTVAELLEIEERYLSEGYEGVICRRQDALYKFGRSTPLEQGMVKVKRFSDSEALIVDMVEEVENTSEPSINELGRQFRRQDKNQVRNKGRMGSLVLQDVRTGIVFNLGTGFSAKDREDFWSNRNSHVLKTIVKYKSFNIGVKDRPRHPVYLGIRHSFDLEP